MRMKGYVRAGAIAVTLAEDLDTVAVRGRSGLDGLRDDRITGAINEAFHVKHANFHLSLAAAHGPVCPGPWRAPLSRHIPEWSGRRRRWDPWDSAPPRCALSTSMMNSHEPQARFRLRERDEAA